MKIPQVNYLYLTKAELPILLDDTHAQVQINTLTERNSLFTIKDLAHVPEQLNRIEKKHDEILSLLKELTGR